VKKMNEADCDGDYVADDDVDAMLSTFFLGDDQDSTDDLFSGASKPASPRQRIEDYMERRRLREEVDDLDFDY
jgi:hypothetical protein